MQTQNIPCLTKRLMLTGVAETIAMSAYHTGASYPNNIDDSLDEQAPIPPVGAPGSIPSWWVSEPYLNLWITARPVYSRSSIDTDFGFAIAYKQRNSGLDTNSFGLGPSWKCNWLSYVSYHEDFDGETKV